MQLTPFPQRGNITRTPFLAAIAAFALFTLTLTPLATPPGTLPGITPGTAAASTAQNVRYFPATRHSVGGAFLKFYDSYGGTSIIGYPLTEEITEGGRIVQYFERARMEYHPELRGTTNEVLLSLLGVQGAQGRPSSARIAPFASTPDRIYIAQTGHSLSYAFLRYWNAYGGVRVFGYPLTEPANENGYLVQYFERARMEYHPEKSGLSYGIELGHLGKEYMKAKGIAETASAPASAASAPAGSSPAGQGNELMTLLNEARRQAGVPPVSLDGQLSGVSQSRSDDMARRNYFSHTTPDGGDFIDALRSAGVPFKLTGEIIAKNNYSADRTLRTAYDTFMNSPAHRVIALDGRYNTAGVGVAKDAGGFYYYTVIFTQR